MYMLSVKKEKQMKITIEIGPNKVTRFFSRVRHSVVGAGKGLKKGWKEAKPPSKPTSVAKKAA